jgi:hypothetical protein
MDTHILAAPWPAFGEVCKDTFAKRLALGILLSLTQCTRPIPRPAVSAAVEPQAPKPTAPRKRRTKKAAAKDPPPVPTAEAPSPAPPAAHASASEEDELWRLHQELLKQIEERKRAQLGLEKQLVQPLTSAAAAAPARTPPKELIFPSGPAATRATTASAATPPTAATPPPVHRRAPAPEPSPPQQPAPPSNPNAMNVVLVGAECAPWSKTGGLGDVMGALPKALATRGHRVMAIAPRYKQYDDAWETGVRLRIRVFNQDHEVGFFHTHKDGVDFMFVDHPAFLSCGGELEY